MRAIAQAARKAIADTLTAEERRWVDRIEALRSEINQSPEPITRVDYGAGSHGTTRDQLEMEAGVEVTGTLGEISRKLSKPPFWGMLLFHLIRGFEPDTCIEMGTAVGLSAAYQAAALALNGHGRLTTLEGARSLADVARSNFLELGLREVEVIVGRFQDTLEEVVRSLPRVDYAFIDGHHDEQATVSYFHTLCGSVAQRALLVFDDIAWSEGMRRAWLTICNDERIAAAIDFGPMGVCVITDEDVKRRSYILALG